MPYSLDPAKWEVTPSVDEYALEPDEIEELDEIENRETRDTVP